MMSLDNQIESYIQYLRQLVRQKKAASSTLDNAKRHLYRYLAFCHSYNSDSIRQQSVNAFVKELKERKYSHTSQYQNVTMIRMAARWLAGQGHKVKIPKYPVAPIKLGKFKKTIVQDEKESLLRYFSTPRDMSNPRGIRNRLVMELMLRHGLSLWEIKKIMLSDVDLGRHTIRIRPQSDRSGRVVKLDGEVSSLAKTYLLTRHDKCPCFIVAFRASDPFIVEAWPLSSRQMERTVRLAVDDLGLDVSINPSFIRKTVMHEDAERLTDDEFRKKYGLSKTSALYYRFTDSRVGGKKAEPIREKNWKAAFEKLRVYYVQNKKWPTGYNELERWAMRQKHLRKIGQLSKGKIRVLDSIGFQWEAQSLFKDQQRK